MATACAPATPIRRSALIPPPSLPSRTGAPLPEGEMRVQAEFNSIELGTYEVVFPIVNSPGVWIPRYQVGGAFYYGISKYVELGVRLLYASAAWSHPNAFGVLPLVTDDTRNLWYGGPGIRVNVPFGKTVDHGPALSFMAEINYSSIPQTTWVCQNCENDPIIPLYLPEKWEREGFLLPNIAAQFGYAFNGMFFISGILGTEATVTNIGFDPNILNIDNSTLERFWVGYFGIGAEFKYDVFVTSVNFYYPFEGEEHIDFGFRMAAMVGFQF